LGEEIKYVLLILGTERKGAIKKNREKSQERKKESKKHVKKKLQASSAA